MRSLPLAPRGITSGMNFSYGTRPDHTRVAPTVIIHMDIDAFYASVAWKKKRAKILSRDQYLCQRCKRYGRQTAATTVHHIKHYDEYPELGLDNSNLVSLCGACHNFFHPEKAEKSNKSKANRHYW